MRKRTILSVLLVFLLLGVSGMVACAQSARSDTLSLKIIFRVNVSDIDLDYEGNRERLEEFRARYNEYMARPNASMTNVIVHTTASPEGDTQMNIALSRKRSEGVKRFICHEFGISPFKVFVTSEGESWKELAAEIKKIDEPWKEKALKIIRDGEQWYIDGGESEDIRKNKLRWLDNGKAWVFLQKNIFPYLRGAYGDAVFVVTSDLTLEEKQAFIEQNIVKEVVRDTVIIENTIVVEKEYNGKLDRKFAARVKDKKFLFSAKTNIFAVPLVNVGMEFPFGKHFSLGVNVYYPWISRNKYHKDCFEFLAYDMDFRYWLGSDRYPDESRLLGHSFGIYGAGGHYDIEKNWSGHQGTFFNIGFDWKYAWPIFHGAMHMEIELGLGFIYSDAQPYDCYEPYGDCFRRPSERRIVRWYGPTRAQLTLVVPFYHKPKQYGRKKK